MHPAVVDGYGYGVAFFGVCALAGVALLVKSVPRLRRGDPFQRLVNLVKASIGLVIVAGSLFLIVMGYINVSPPD